MTNSATICHMFTDLITTGVVLADEGQPSGPFYEIMGLPVHPLVLHVAVVFLPLAALGCIAIFAFAKLRRSIGWLVMMALLIGAGAAYVSKESGEQLAAAIGLPTRHAQLAEQVTIMSFVLLGVGFAWYLVARMGDRKQDKAAATAAAANEPGAPVEPVVTRKGQSTLALVLGLIMVIVALLTLVWIALVGHSGAEAVWKGELPDPSQSAAGASPSASPAVSPSGNDAVTEYTFAEVAAHATPADCWAVVDNNVYNLTSWESKHPGGAAAIDQLCGQDASSAFRGQHGKQTKPMTSWPDSRSGCCPVARWALPPTRVRSQARAPP
jgi:hypothetical protein